MKIIIFDGNTRKQTESSTEERQRKAQESGKAFVPQQRKHLPEAKK